MLTPPTIAICIRLLNTGGSVLKKKSGRNGKQKPATTPLKRVVYMPVVAAGKTLRFSMEIRRAVARSTLQDGRNMKS